MLHKHVQRLGVDHRDYVNLVLSHPEVYEWISDDNSPAPGQTDFAAILSAEGIYVLRPNPWTVFILHPWNSICYEVHTNVLPEGRGPMAVQACREGMSWMFHNTPCQKIVTQVPTFNRPALALARRAGMKPEGINSKSFLKNGHLYDQTILGISKQEVMPCPQ